MNDSRKSNGNTLPTNTIVHTFLEAKLLNKNGITQQVFLLADSQGRNLSGMLKECLPSEFDINCFIYPCTNFKAIKKFTSDHGVKMTVSLQKANDTVILIAG